jgi:transcriptional regulator with XRE-family HTH domain
MSQLGIILRNKREELGLSIAQVAKATNIRSTILEALEKGDHSILPITYLRSFARNYWNHLGLPVKEFDQAMIDSGLLSAPKEASFLENLIPGNSANHDADSQTVSAPLKPIQAARYSPVLISGILSTALIMAAGVLIYYLGFRKVLPEQPVQPSPSALPPAEIADSSKSQQNGGGLISMINENIQQPDSIALEAIATDSTWLTINADGKRSEQVVLYPGNQRRWTALQYFKLSIGNAGGVEFRRNGQNIPPLGKKGTIIRDAKITATDISTSAAPYKQMADTLRLQQNSAQNSRQQSPKDNNKINTKTGTTQQSNIRNAQGKSVSIAAPKQINKNQAIAAKKTVRTEGNSPKVKKTESAKKQDRKIPELRPIPIEHAPRRQ